MSELVEQRNIEMARYLDESGLAPKPKEVVKSQLIWQAKLASVLNTNFGAPFLPEGYVSVTVEPDASLRIKIGRRAIHIDCNLEILSTGTDLREVKP